MPPLPAVVLVGNQPIRDTARLCPRPETRRTPATCPVRNTAHADDMVAIDFNWHAAWPHLRHIFHRLERVAGLSVNAATCVVIPLWFGEVADVTRELKGTDDARADCEVSLAATYHGVHLGQSAREHAWAKLLNKFRRLLGAWAWSPCGLAWNRMAFSYFGTSLFGLLSQSPFCNCGRGVWSRGITNALLVSGLAQGARSERQINISFEECGAVRRSRWTWS